METEEINKLREDAEWAHANEWEVPITLGDHLEKAASALESQRARIAEMEKRIESAVKTLQKIDWVGSGAKGRIGDAIDVLIGCKAEEGKTNAP